MKVSAVAEGRMVTVLNLSLAMMHSRRSAAMTAKKAHHTTSSRTSKGTMAATNTLRNTRKLNRFSLHALLVVDSPTQSKGSVRGRTWQVVGKHVSGRVWSVRLSWLPVSAVS